MVKKQYCKGKYKKSVSQKNKLLSGNGNFEIRELEIWNQQLVTYGSEIIFKRLKFIEFANSKISSSYQNISKNKEKITIIYNSTLNELSSKSTLNDIKIFFRKALENSKDNEKKRKVCLIGPHKDDLGFLKNNYSFKSHGSQGENKSFLLALKIIESSFIMEVSNKRPLFLLDDIFGELDEERINNLVQLIKKEGQTFITTTEINKFKNSVPGNTKFIHIQNHAIN